MKMYLFIINPVSGGGKSLQVWEKVKKNLEQDRIEYRSFFTKYSGHASEIALQIAELHKDKIEAIVAIGGDGTVHEVTNGLVGYPQIPIGYIPAGSGNDFARGFLIPKSPLKALQKILKQKGRLPKKYDVGCFKTGTRKKAERFFLNGLGIGFDGDVAKEANESGYKALLNRWKLGSLAYVLIAIKMLKSYQPHELVVTIDGHETSYSNVWLIAINNTPYYGGGMKISPQAKTTDGYLNICIVHNLSRWKILFLFATVFFGLHTKFDGVTMLQGQSIEVTSEKPITIQADGEIVGTTPVEIQVEARRRYIL